MKFLVVGSGGNGQTYFMDFLSQNNIPINSIHDRDKYKHKSKPNDKIKTIFNKVIFIYNDPLFSVLSHLRRKWAIAQVKKLGNPFNLCKKEVHRQNLLFKKTIENNRDIFGIEYQFDNWLNCDLPILFLDFNEVIEKKEILNKFLGTKLCYDKFNVKPRSSSKDISNKKIIKIYEDLYEKIKTKSHIKNLCLN